MSMQASRIWVIRHGDRFDYEVGDEKWASVAQRLKDPPLSDLGNRQAAEVATALSVESSSSDKPITKIITSPFLRCVETANPLAGKLGLPLLVDHALFEVGHTFVEMPPLAERAAYFPRINLQYESSSKPSPDESFPVGAMVRFGETTDQLVKRFPSESCVLVTHAAGVVAIVAKLLKKSIRDVPPASPCCLYCLDRESDDSDNWVLSSTFNGSTSHLSELGQTLPWPREGSSGGESYLKAGDTAPWLA